MSPASAAVPGTIPLTFTNNSGRGEAMYLYVLGESLTTHRLGWADAGGGFHEWTGGAIPPQPAPDVAIPGPAAGQSTTIQIPKLSGRIYFSYGAKLKFFLVPTPIGVGLVQPSLSNPADPNINTFFDWSEYTLNDSGLWINSSQVDQLSIPHAVGVKGQNGATKSTGRMVPNGRNLVFDALKGQPGGWGNLVRTRSSDGLRLRALAPGKGIDAGVLPANVMDSYITKAWNAYTSRDLRVVPFSNEPNTVYYGRTSGGVMNFRNGSGQVVASISRPSSANVFGCDGALVAPNDRVRGPIARTLCAALNRSTMHSVATQPDLNSAGFYQDASTNHYARFIHARMVDGKAYAFAFDDVGAFESLVHDGDPRAAYITIDKL